MSYCIEWNLGRLSAITFAIILLLGICHAERAEQFLDQPMNIYEDYGVGGSKTVNGREVFPRAIHDNGMLHLVLHYLAVQLIKEMQADEETRFSRRQRTVLHDKITGFYDEILKHPALNNNRVAFSQKKPDFAQFWPSSDLSEANASYDTKDKRTGGRLTEICTSTSGWEEEVEGRTRSRDLVVLYPNQHFYTTKCDDAGLTCNYIAPGITSGCATRSSWTIAYVDDGANSYKWEWISINTCCSCAASSK